MTLRLFAMIACATTLIACSTEPKVELDDALPQQLSFVHLGHACKTLPH